MKIGYSFILIFLLSFSLYADVFRLKNGEIIEGELVSEDSTGIVIRIKYGTVRVDKSEIIIPEKKSVAQIKPIQVLKPSITLSKLSNLTSQEKLSGMHKWLIGQIYPKTGLVESYRPTSDVYLEKQAATYDQALAGLSFLVVGDVKKAKAILDFYKAKWNGNGFSNFYFTPTGNPGIEGTTHLGPNLWIALLALHYDRIVGKNQYQGLSEDIVNWAISLPHFRGGAAMSNHDEWRAPWTKVVSTENNIDYYTVLNILGGWVNDPGFREKIQQEKFGVIDFICKTVYDRKTGGIYRGFHEGIIDREYALDTITWLVAAVGIKRLREWGIDIEKLIAFSERNFLVEDSDIKGFDFTDKRGAFKAKRPRMISIEWTLGMVNLYCIYRNYYCKLASEQERLGNNKKANNIYKGACICEHKAVYYLKQIDKKLLRFGTEENLYAYPYATKSYWLVFYDSPWWKTPKAGTNDTPAGSVASVTWRIFAGRFNPLNPAGELE